jgi:hypothetical protein
MPITIEEVVESAARGVLRAMDARVQGGAKVMGTVPELVRSGFHIDFTIRAGGDIPIAALSSQPQLPRGGEGTLNPEQG